ncbi:hypothetical protein FO519_002111 [Halicephalobus sp. NKZ332]|nr:hypothetical protein FO519_002111 [Halicephalobus sp. NKZ332]
MKDKTNSRCKWDLLLFTANGPQQAQVFETQISGIYSAIIKYFKNYIVQQDPSEDFGSGLSTWNALFDLMGTPHGLGGKKILLINTGGYSKRLPHCAPLGKLFTCLSDGRTLLEHKLETFCDLPTYLPPGVLVAASDTIETLNKLPSSVFDNISKDFILFGHYSTQKIANNHGVYIPETWDGNRLTVKKVLQKPDNEILESENAKQENGLYITDSCYFMASSYCENFVNITTKFKDELTATNLCCYGDFLRPIGSEASDDYVEGTTDPVTRKWRRHFFDFFNKVTGNETLIVHEESKFHHFGTSIEFLENILQDGPVWTQDSSNVIYSIIGSPGSSYKPHIGNNSFVEFCQYGENVEIGDNCLVSGIDLSGAGDIEKLQIPSNCIVITWPLTLPHLEVPHLYVTIILPIDADMKESQAITWFNFNEKSSFYTAQIFPLAKNPAESLERSLECYRTGILTAFTDDQLSQRSYPFVPNLRCLAVLLGR